MYRASKIDGSPALVCQGEAPDLLSTNAFWTLIETLPKECPIPTPIVKLGLMTRHLKPKTEDIVVNFGYRDVHSPDTVTLNPVALSRVRWLLSNYSDHLTDKEKRKVGEFCERSHLNCPPEDGASKQEVVESVSGENVGAYPFLVHESSIHSCEYCGREYNSPAALNGHLASCEEYQSQTSKQRSDEEISPEKEFIDRPAFGKEIRRETASDRVSGRNPFADSDQIKDTGIHQGGN